MRNVLPTYVEIVDPIVEPYVNIIQQLIQHPEIMAKKKSEQMVFMVKNGIRVVDVARIYDVGVGYVGQATSRDKHKKEKETE